MDQITKKENTTAQEASSKENKFTWSQLAERLSFGRMELHEAQTLIVHNIDPSDFLSLVEETDPAGRLRIFVEIMQRQSLEVSFEGSVVLGAFDISDSSWTLTPGEGKYLQISSRPSTMRKTIVELVSFLKKLPQGQAWAFKPFQRLFIEELSSDAMFTYYQHCQENSELTSQESEQDLLFTSSCDTLAKESLILKVYGVNAAQVNRNIDTSAGGILFSPESNAEFKQPRIIIGLVANT